MAEVIAVVAFGNAEKDMAAASAGKSYTELISRISTSVSSVREVAQSIARENRVGALFFSREKESGKLVLTYATNGSHENLPRIFGYRKEVLMSPEQALRKVFGIGGYNDE